MVCNSFWLKYRSVMVVNCRSWRALGGVCWLAENQSASQEGLCFRESVSNSAGLPSQQSARFLLTPEFPLVRCNSTAAALCLIYRRADRAAVLGESQTLFYWDSLHRGCVAIGWLGSFVRGIPWYHTTPHALKRTRVSALRGERARGVLLKFLILYLRTAWVFNLPILQ